MLRHFIIIVILFFITNWANAQIVVDKGGDNWSTKVDSALVLIKETSPKHWKMVQESCNHISMWNGKTSTTGSTGVASLYAPSVVGAVTISGKAAVTDDAPTGTAFSVALSVNDGNAVLLTQIDALNAKIVALNALIAKIMKKLGVK